MTFPLNSAATRLAWALAWALLWVLATCLPAQAGADRYQPNAVGDEITDTATGLIWRRCAEGQSWTGSACTGAPAHFNWDGALALANDQASISGLTWRLPNAKELASLVKASQVNPSIDTTAFPGATSDLFWSSTPFADSTLRLFFSWIVDFGVGQVYADYRYGSYLARLVRDAQ